MFDLTYRPRRLRTSQGMRDLVRETSLDVSDLIYPLFFYSRQVPLYLELPLYKN